MLGLSLSVPYNHITGDPSLITGLIGWWDFTKIETMTQNVDRSSPVTADGQYIGTINNLATGTEVGLATQTVGAGKLGEASVPLPPSPPLVPGVPGAGAV